MGSYEQASPTKISVIVVAHDRRKYLRDALESVLRQSLKENVEIIVVKNFTDENIDKFIKRNNIKNIFNTERTWIGANYSLGVKAAEGSVVTFLDDDDLYDEKRLERIEYVFNNYRNLCYYYNNILAIDEYGRAISNYDRRMIKLGRKIDLNKEILLDETIPLRVRFKILKEYDAIWSPSCIAIKRGILLPLIRDLENIRLAPGIFMASTIISNKECSALLDNRKLTYYRVHASTSHPTIPNKYHYLKYREQFYRNSIYSLENTMKCVNNNDAIDFVSIFLLLAKLGYFITYSHKSMSRSELFSDIRVLFNNKDLLRPAELLAILTLIASSLILPRKILQNILYFIEQKEAKSYNF
jgi:glycosyltransferase involved in cell wall biosynthesis